MLHSIDVLLESRRLGWNQLPSWAAEIRNVYGTLVGKYIYKRTLAGPKISWQNNINQ
jgi:hypothetical protein